MALYALHVETRGGIADLARVVGVLALYDLTPLSMSARTVVSGLWIDTLLRGDACACEHCASRLSSIFAVSVAQLTPEINPCEMPS